jgi:hypothetical protein
MTAVIDERLSWIAYHRDEPAGAPLHSDLTPFFHAIRYRFGMTTPWHPCSLQFGAVLR